ncbi:luciferin 4-monooxygenase-like [Coccinella septempunctata]|uniref:luciferin 4-monooxygenase-like n=1 Tax=Coccinella septempunctata TaxID=41139 RepID=UPI001D05E41E|nr:luciferin 4-monooxygenase-like [Coccinella septempunctata]
MRKYISEGNLLVGEDVVFEPAEGGLGHEVFKALNLNKGKIVERILETGEEISYDDLLIRSVRVALFFAEKKLKKDDVVCLCSRNNSHTMVTLIASKFADVHFSAMEPTLPLDDIIYLINLIRPKVLFVVENVITKIEEAFKKLDFRCELVLLGCESTKYTNIHQLYSPKEEEEKYRPSFVKNLKETAIIFLSSGTSGKPKAVCVNHYALLAQIYILASQFHRKGTVRFSNFTEEFSTGENSILHYAPLYWLTGVMFSMIPIFCGGTFLIGTSFNAANAWNALEKYQPDSIILPPGQTNELCSYGFSKKRIKSVNIFGVGGGFVTTTHMKDMKKCFPNTKITQLYGQTENTGPISLFNSSDPEEMEYQQNHLNSCGKPVNGFKMKVVNVDTEEICGPGERGELRTLSKYIMNEYYKMDSSFAFDSDGWFKTGDLVYFDENGCIYVVDRIKDLILYSLHNIAPSVIENILKQHPAVFECCVVGKPHLRDNEHPIGIVVLREDHKGKTTEEEIVSFVNERVPDDRYKIRAGIIFIEGMLKTSTGKIRKLEMKRRLIEGLPI